MKKNQRNLLIMGFLYSFGRAIVGAFFPFLVANAFGFEVWQLMIWLAVFSFAGFILIYPINKFLNKYFSVRQKLQIGLLFLAFFYILISLSRNSTGIISLATLFFTLGILVFWPSYHLFNSYSTEKNKRGNYVGNMQIIAIGANILAPLASGFLLQKNLDSWVVSVAALFLGGAIYFARKLEFPKYPLDDSSSIHQFFLQSFYKKRIFKITIIEAIQHSTLWAIWPIFFKSVLTGFAQMGAMVSFTAIVEIISSKISGKLVDKKSAKKNLNFSSIARFFDLGIRGLLFWFPTTLMAGVASFFAGFLGPIFNISFYTRIIELAEERPKKEFEFFILREILLNLVETFMYIIAAILAFYLGIKSFVILIFIAAVSSFGLRKT